MGIFKKRLICIQTNFGSAHFFRTWSESALRPPSRPEGPSILFFWPPPPPPACVGRWGGHFSEPAYRAPQPARSPTRVSRRPLPARHRRRTHSKERAPTSRTMPNTSPGGAWSARYSRSQSAHATRKPSQATRKPSQATRKLAHRPKAPKTARGPGAPGPRCRPAGPRNRRFQARLRGRGRCPVTHPHISPAAGPVERAVPPPKSPRFPKANAGGPAPAGRLAAAQWSISSGFRVAWAALSGSLARSRPVLRPPAAGTSRPRVPQAFCGRPPA